MALIQDVLSAESLKGILLVYILLCSVQKGQPSAWLPTWNRLQSFKNVVFFCAVLFDHSWMTMYSWSVWMDLFDSVMIGKPLTRSHWLTRSLFLVTVFMGLVNVQFVLVQTAWDAIV